FGFHADGPQPAHAASAPGRIGELLEIGFDRHSAPTKRIGVHVVVAAIVDMADETGLWPCLELHKQAIDRTFRNLAGVARDERRLPQPGLLRVIRQRDGHGIVLSEMNCCLSIRLTPSIRLTSTWLAPARYSRQFTAA